MLQLPTQHFFVFHMIYHLMLVELMVVVVIQVSAILHLMVVAVAVVVVVADDEVME